MVAPKLLTSTQAARLAAVAPSTIKRWADQGRLASIRTLGGHRRFDRADLARLLREQRGGAEEEPRTDPWIEALVAGRRHDVESCLLEARWRLGSWSRVADELGVVLADLGSRWAGGSLSIADEHVASETLRRALARVGDTFPSHPGGPRCVLACAEGDEHVLGLALVELCAREQGWTPLWLGRRTPPGEILGVLGALEVGVVALSASAASTDAPRLAALAAEVGEGCREHGADLMLGGAGAWPDAPEHGVRLRSISAIPERLAAQEPGIRSSS
jgi:excisionase family DNA binding protein